MLYIFPLSYILAPSRVKKIVCNTSASTFYHKNNGNIDTADLYLTC